MPRLLADPSGPRRVLINRHLTCVLFSRSSVMAQTAIWKAFSRCPIYSFRLIGGPTAPLRHPRRGRRDHHGRRHRERRSAGRCPRAETPTSVLMVRCDGIRPRRAGRTAQLEPQRLAVLRRSRWPAGWPAAAPTRPPRWWAEAVSAGPAHRASGPQPHPDWVYHADGRPMAGRISHRGCIGRTGEPSWPAPDPVRPSRPPR